MSAPSRDVRIQPSEAERAFRRSEAVRVALREGLGRGAALAVGVVGAHYALDALVTEQYRRAPVPLKRIVATVVILGGAWLSANVGYARQVQRWNAGE